MYLRAKKTWLDMTANTSTAGEGQACVQPLSEKKSFSDVIVVLSVGSQRFPGLSLHEPILLSDRFFVETADKGRGQIAKITLRFFSDSHHGSPFQSMLVREHPYIFCEHERDASDEKGGV